MFQSWRLQLREAELAYKAGRLEEASRLLGSGSLPEFLPARNLQTKVAQKFVDRGRAQLATGETSAGWHDLEAAAALGADQKSLADLRSRLVDHSLREVVRLLAAEEIDTALARLDRLAGQGTLPSRARRLRQVALKLRAAGRLKREGRFPQAEHELAGAMALAPEEKFLAELHKRCQAQAAQFRRMSQQLHRHLAASSFSEVLSVADEMLTLAPECRAALEARQRAWEAVGVVAAVSTESSESPPFYPVHRDENCIQRREAPRAMNGHRMTNHRGGNRRFLLWVDAVGGYLVCRGDEITLGQPVPGGRVDVPILGDLSRIHAVIRRDGEGYLLDPVRTMSLDGRPLSDVAPLRDGSLIRLGGGVEIRFRRPHALSGTARLEIASGHRTQPAVDAVLLMAESCVLGPDSTSHVVCPQWPREVVLFGRGDALEVRTEESFEIDGRRCDRRGQLRPGGHVAGDDFSLSVETI